MRCVWPCLCFPLPSYRRTHLIAIIYRSMMHLYPKLYWSCFIWGKRRDHPKMKILLSFTWFKWQNFHFWVNCLLKDLACALKCHFEEHFKISTWQRRSDLPNTRVRYKGDNQAKADWSFFSRQRALYNWTNCYYYFGSPILAYEEWGI